MLSRDELITADSSIIITSELNSSDKITGIAPLEDGNIYDGRWVPELRMNGDQNYQERQVHLPDDTFSIQRLTLYKYK